MLGATSLAGLTLAGCATTAPVPKPKLQVTPAIPTEYLAMYGALPSERFPIPAAQIDLIDPIYWRQEVANATGEAPGTVVVDTPGRFVYWTMPVGRGNR